LFHHHDEHNRGLGLKTRCFKAQDFLYLFVYWLPTERRSSVVGGVQDVVQNKHALLKKKKKDELHISK
jgi:hypothetical protein